MAETKPTVEEAKVDDKEVLNVDDDAEAVKSTETKPEITTDEAKDDTKDDAKDDAKDDTKDNVKKKVEEEEESDLSSSDDDEEDLISNTEDWDITFKLAQFLDTHFILPLLNHLKNQKKVLEKSKTKGDTKEEKDKEEEQQQEETTDDAKDDKKENKPETKQQSTMIMRPNEISLVSEQLMTLYDDEEINKIEFQLLSKTCLIDEQLELFDVLQDTKQDPQKQNLTEYRKKVIAKLTELEEICGPLIDFLGDEKSVNDLIREKSFDLRSITTKNKELTLDNFNIDHLFAYCRLRYEVGFYQNTDLLLSYYRLLTPDLAKKNAALWGQLSAQILQAKWNAAFKTIRDIKEIIEDNSRTLSLNKGEEVAVVAEEEEDEWTKKARELLEAQQKAEEEEAAAVSNEDNIEEEKDDKKEDKKDDSRKTQSLQIASIIRDRAWLLHWSLFVFFNGTNLLDELIALFTSTKYMNVIQTMCPHLLRYLTSAILITPNIDKQSKLKYLTDISKIIIEEQYTYKDPITEFVRLVIRTNDFEGASIMLGYAMDVIKCDFFLAYYQDYFIQYARTTFLIKYCRLYNRISVQNISKLLLMDNFSNDEQQLWLINAIRSENINAKLDVVENVIYVHFNETNPYQEMADRTKSMNNRTIALYQQIKNKEQQMFEAENQ